MENLQAIQTVGGIVTDLGMVGLMLVFLYLTRLDLQREKDRNERLQDKLIEIVEDKAENALKGQFKPFS